MEASEALLETALLRAPAPRQMEVAQALVPGLCQSSKHYAAGLRVARTLDINRTEAMALAFAQKLLLPRSCDSYGKFYSVLNNASMNELTAYQFVRWVSADDLNTYGDFIETPVGRKYWDVSLALASAFKPNMPGP